MAEKESLIIEKGQASPEQVGEVEEGKYYTVKQLAQLLHVGSAWISKLCISGKIRAVKPVGRAWRIPASEVRRLTEKGLEPVSRLPPVSEITIPAEKLSRVFPKVEKPAPPAQEKKAGGIFWFLED